MEDYELQRKKTGSRVRSIVDYVMGTVFVSSGIYFLTYEKFGINIFRREPSSIDYLIGGLFVVYGSWRIYRGYKKNYLKV